MDPFNLDVRVTTPTSATTPAAPASVSGLVTRYACTKTPVCSKATCQCTTVGACTSGCRR